MGYGEMCNRSIVYSVTLPRIHNKIGVDSAQNRCIFIKKDEKTVPDNQNSLLEKI